MTNLPAWHDANGQFLAAALCWVRLRLERCARRATTTEVADQPDAVTTGSERTDDLDREESIASAAMQVAAEIDPPPALMVLAERLGLSRFEQDIVLLCTAMEIDPRVPALCASAHGHKPYPTFALAMTAFDDPAWDALSPHRPLRFWRLLEIAQPGNLPLTASALRVDERIASYIKGLNELDDRLSSILVGEGESVEAPLAPSQRETVNRISRTLAVEGAGSIVELVGHDAGSKSIVAGRVARDAGRRLLRLSAELLPLAASDIETMGRLCQRESLLLPIVFYLDVEDVEPVAGDRAAAVRQFLGRCGAPVILSTREPWPRPGRSLLRFDVEKPTRIEQEETWRVMLGPADAPLAERLSSQFNLDVQAIHDIASRTSEAVEGTSRATELWDACSGCVRPRLDSLAERITTRATWDDLVLPEEQMLMLRQIAAQVIHRTKVYEEWELGRRVQRGLGIGALFAGESGTGKTLAAEVLASHLRLSLYRIDLSSVVSKYIGETEKNLRRLFDAAEAGGCILFFDEADALFGRRTEVKDSHDRYANIEVNYLLQRMESFHGLAILATNLRSTLDTAFLRRLRFIVTFPFPSTADRRRIWKRVFPAVAPVRDLDYERLARFGLTGAAIRNVAVNAAFLAAADARTIGMGHVLEAARSEFAKLERPVSPAAFDWPETEAVR